MSQIICRGDSTIGVTSAYGDVFLSCEERIYFLLTTKDTHENRCFACVYYCEKVFIFPLTTEERRKKMAYRTATLGKGILH